MKTLVMMNKQEKIIFSKFKKTSILYSDKDLISHKIKKR